VVTGFWRVLRIVEPMSRRATSSGRIRRHQRERQRREARADGSTEPALRPRPEADGSTRRTAATSCGWCGGPITPGRRGPIPKWCSATCRHRAWEQSRAAASGRAAVQVVERRVEVPIPLAPTRRDWPRLLSELVCQLDDQRIYDRDLEQLQIALIEVVDALHRRTVP